jgi:phosphomannomutase
MSGLKSAVAFGPDGWCGVMEEDFTDENVLSVASAFTHWLVEKFKSVSEIEGKTKKETSVAVGYDGRKNSRYFAELFSDIVVSNGIKVLFSASIVPTPVLSFGTKYYDCDAGIMITAGDSPPNYNGIKFKTSYGGPFMSEETKSVELFLRSNERLKTNALPVAKIVETDFLPDYLKQLESLVDFSLLRSYAADPNNRASVLIDSMGGAGQTILEDILTGCGWRAQTLFGTPEPTFYDRVPKADGKNLGPLKYNVSVTDAALGLATDGDASHFGIVFDDGGWVSIEETRLALNWHLRGNKKWSKGMFGCDENSGFWYGDSSPRNSSDENFGGELDGILSCLFIVEMLAMTGKSLREVVALQEKFGL